MSKEKQKKPHVIEMYYSNGIPCYHITPLDDFIEVVEKHTRSEILLDKIKQSIYDNNCVLHLDLTHIYDADYFNRFVEYKAKEWLESENPEYLFYEANKGNINILFVNNIEKIRGHHKHDDWSPVQALVSFTNSEICPHEMSIQLCVKIWLINKHKIKEEEIPEHIDQDFITKVFNRCNAEKFIERIMLD